MSRIHEQSAGGIVYRKQGGKIEIFLLQWINARGDQIYVLPKGKIEEGEDIQSTALREVSEETGFAQKDLDVIKFIRKVNYNFIASYKEGSPVIDKDVYLFLVKYLGHDEPVFEKDKRFVGFRWCQVDELSKLTMRPNVHELVQNNLCYM